MSTIKWKTYFGRCIYESPSGFQVVQNTRYRWLSFGNNVLQTLINRRQPERGGLEYVQPLSQMVLTFPGDSCLLGLGGAGLAHTLYPAMANARIDAVEKSDEVIDIATRYFNTSRISNLSITHQNAADFVQSTTSMYQHILIDLYNANAYPTECNNDIFFANCKALLKPEGIMTINVINIRENWEQFQKIRSQFNNCTIVVPITGTSNTLIFAFNMPNTSIFLDKIQTIRTMKQLIWDGVWGCTGRI